MQLLTWVAKMRGYDMWGNWGCAVSGVRCGGDGRSKQANRQRRTGVLGFGMELHSQGSAIEIGTKLASKSRRAEGKMCG
jgi:hypothetical protein